MRNVKVLLLGDGDTNQTKFAVHCTTGNPPDEYTPSVFNYYKASLKVGDQELSLQLWCTPGQEDYRKLRPLSYPGTDIVLLFFSYAFDTSLENVSSMWMPEIIGNIGRPPVFMLVGVGDKLVDNHELLEAMGKCPFADRSVSDEMVQKVIAEIEPDDFMYCCPTMNGSFKMVVDRVAEIYLEKIKQQETEAKNKEEEKGEKKKHKRRWWQRKDKGKK